jgi:uncharacterized protein YidB (DUF937 family)
MKKVFISIVLVAVVAIALGSAGFVYAQSTTPTTPVPGSGYGMMSGGRGMRGGMMGNPAANIDQDGPMHDEMIAAFAQKLGISVDDLNARLSKGETMAQIATSKGLTADQFTTLMADARSQAVDQAVKNGTLTQAQADWMKQHGAGQMRGNGQMSGGRGMRGSGQGQFTNPNCPYVQTTP